MHRRQAYDKLITQLVTEEIMKWPLEHNDLYHQFLNREFGSKDQARCTEWWERFELRVTEKNIRVVAKVGVCAVVAFVLRPTIAL